jgi:hypothetical protein
MKFTAPTAYYGNTNDNYRPCPPGVFAAALYRVLDMGTQTEIFDGKQSQRRKILLSFEILDDDATTNDGAHLSVHKRFSWTMHPQGSLRGFLANWRGKPFTDTEANSFDFERVMGQVALLNIIHNERQGKVFANISSITPLPRGMTAAKPQNQHVMFHCDYPDLALLDMMGRGLRESIEASPEFQNAMGTVPRTATTPSPQPAPNAYAALRGDSGYRRPTPPPPPTEDADFDDDVPF